MKRACLFLMLVHVAVPAACDSLTRKKPKLPQVHAFTLGNTLNGGLVGALGPSMATFASSTGLNNAALARTIMLNRAAKLCGTFAWAFYAERLQRGKAMLGIGPQQLLVAVMFLEVLCALTIVSFRSSSFALQAALIIFGWCYGLADSGFDLITVWSETGNAKETRTQVAMLNAGFTAGAVLTPAVVGLALRLGGTSYACFVVLALMAALAGVALAASDVLPEGAPPLEMEPTDLTEAEAASEAMESATDASVATPSSMTSTTTSSPSSSRQLAGHLFVSCMFIVLFCATGSEHVVGTWLPTLGSKLGSLDMATMAMMSSFYWSTICVGRVGWCLLSQHIKSAWPVLAMDGVVMLLAGVGFSLYSPSRGPWLLWASCLLLGLGCASSLPCALTMPAEAHVALTPVVLMCLNLAGTIGESETQHGESTC